jgi:GNAT superfamily N-acetyltransferase
MLLVRPMTPADVAPSAAMYGAGGWGEREEFLEWLMRVPVCRPLVGEADGEVVATGLATVNGEVGWVGSIFVAVGHRSRGYGRRMTEAVCELIDAAGCRTQVLIASPLGEPLYASMGFRYGGDYQIFEAATTPELPRLPPDSSYRSIGPADLVAVHELDRRATGEDRSGLLASLVPGGSVLVRGGEVRGYLMSTLPDSGALAALDAEAGLGLLALLRHNAHGTSATVHAAVPAGQAAALEAVAAAGWRPLFRTPRMLRGDSIVWEPGLIWSILGFAFG